MQINLENKSAVVTGGGSGSGKQIALTLATYGASLTVGDLNKESGEQTVKEIKNEGGHAQNVVTDVSDNSQVTGLIKAAEDEFGGVDILVNNAGFGFTSTVIEMTEEDWDRVLGVNLKGQFLCSKAAALSMIKTGTNGRIVNIASTAAVNGRYAGGAYCAAKAGVVQLTKVMSMELGEYGINVNSVGPGLTETPANLNLTSEYRDNFVDQVALGRRAKPNDIASAVLFLTSSLADYITGQVIYVDGGYSAGKLTVRG